MKKRRLLRLTAIVIAAILIVYIGLSIYGAKKAMEIPRLPLNNSPSSIGLDYENVSFKSRDDNVLLRGWYIPNSGNYVIVIVHGGFQNRVDDNVDTLALTHDLVKKGYNVLLFDLRGRGESEGKGLALSNIELDIGGAVDYLTGRGVPSNCIFLMGFCSGAASSCIFASQNKIGALVLDGCFIDVPTMVTREAASFGIPEFLVTLFVPGLLSMTSIIYDYDMVNPIDVVDKVACPILFVHEELDESIKWEEVNKLFSASSNPASEIWQISNTEHSQGYRTHPLEYIEKVDTFLSANSRATSSN